MSEVLLQEEDVVDYSKLLNIQFIDFARKEVISNKEAHKRFLNCFTELYGPPLGGTKNLEKILSGEMVLSSNICITCVKQYMHCPLIRVFKALIQGALNTELIDLSNTIVSRALIS
tara:strand:+ start:124 stop:471 length:348 start_codon:yes stop_codon:yes gene_type:complete